MAVLHTSTFAVVAALLLSGCDQAPGIDSAAGESPVLSAFQFDPQSVSADDPIVDETGSSIRFPLNLDVTATDADGDLESVAYLIQSPLLQSEPILEGELARTQGDQFHREVSVSIPKGETGVYTVLVYAIDATGAVSDDVRGMLTVGGTGEPPELLDVVVPDTVQRPASGDPPVLLRLMASVSDPDGLTNINSVQFWNVATPDSRFQMYDDGQFEQSGDEEEGDGTYTAVVRIESTNQPGENILAFQASDRSGLTSNIVEKTIVVE